MKVILKSVVDTSMPWGSFIHRNKMLSLRPNKADAQWSKCWCLLCLTLESTSFKIQTSLTLLQQPSILIMVNKNIMLELTYLSKYSKAPPQLISFMTSSDYLTTKFAHTLLSKSSLVSSKHFTITECLLAWSRSQATCCMRSLSSLAAKEPNKQ